MPVFTIDIISDPVCPWCYIGYLHLQRAINLFSKTHHLSRSSTFQLQWHPYYLDPTATKEKSLTKREAIVKKNGKENEEKILKILEKLGVREGIKFDMEGKVGWTRDAHRLLAYAGKKGNDTQTLVAETMFKGHFEHGADVSDLDFLEKIGSEAGLDGLSLRSWLEGEEEGSEVDDQAKKNREDGIGVPRFTIQKKFKLDGAVPVEDFFEMFIKIAEEQDDEDGGRRVGQLCD